MASRRWVQGGRNFAFDYLIRAAACVEFWDLIQQRLGIGVPRTVKQVRRRCNFDNAAKIHHDDPIRDMFDHPQIMADEQIGQIKIASEILKQVDNLRLDRNIKRRDAFVTDQEFRLDRKGTGNSDALTLPARKLMWDTFAHKMGLARLWSSDPQHRPPCRAGTSNHETPPLRR